MKTIFGSTPIVVAWQGMDQGYYYRENTNVEGQQWIVLLKCNFWTGSNSYSTLFELHVTTFEFLLT